MVETMDKIEFYIKQDNRKKGRVLISTSEDDLKPCLSVPIEKNEWYKVTMEKLPL